MAILPDGTYDVIVVDADTDEHGDVHLEVAITLGPLIGHVVALRGMHVDDRQRGARPVDAISLMGVPGTMRVRDGVPSFRPEIV